MQITHDFDIDIMNGVKRLVKGKRCGRRKDGSYSTGGFLTLPQEWVGRQVFVCAITADDSSAPRPHSVKESVRSYLLQSPSGYYTIAHIADQLQCSKDAVSEALKGPGKKRGGARAADGLTGELQGLTVLKDPQYPLKVNGRENVTLPHHTLIFQWIRPS